MKKVTLLFAVVLAVVLVLVACGGNNTTTTTAATTTTEATTTAATTTAATTTAATTTAATTTAATTTAATTTTAPVVADQAADALKADPAKAPVLNLEFEDLKNMTGATVNGPVASVAGPSGNAAQFGQGTDASFIQVPNSDAINFETTDEFTIDFWYKLDTDAKGWKNIFCKGNKNTGWYGVWLAPADGATQGVCWGGDTGNSMIGSVESKEIWHRITVIQKEGKISTYLDGTLVKADIASKPYVSTTDLFIGGGSTPVDGNQQFKGAIDSFKIYDYAWAETYGPVNPLADKIYADIDFNADGTMVDNKGKLDLALLGTAKIETKDVTHNGTTIQLPTLQANGTNVGTATFKEFTDAATALAFWNDADGFSLEAFFVARGATTAVEGVFCATENPSVRSGVGIAMAAGGKPYLCLGLSDNSYLSVTSANAVSTTEYVHVITTTIVENGTTKGVVYVNGVKVAEGSKAATIHVTDINKTLVIGGDTNKTAGKVDFPNDDFSVADIKVYGVALTADEVKAAYDFTTAANMLKSIQLQAIANISG